MLSFELTTQILRVHSVTSSSVFRFQWKTLEPVRMRRQRRKTRPSVRCVAGVTVRTDFCSVMAVMLGKGNGAFCLPCRLLNCPKSRVGKTEGAPVVQGLKRAL